MSASLSIIISCVVPIFSAASNSSVIFCQYIHPRPRETEVFVAEFSAFSFPQNNGLCWRKTARRRSHRKNDLSIWSIDQIYIGHIFHDRMTGLSVRESEKRVKRARKKKSMDEKEDESWQIYIYTLLSCPRDAMGNFTRIPIRVSAVTCHYEKIQSCERLYRLFLQLYSCWLRCVNKHSWLMHGKYIIYYCRKL